MSSGLLFYGSVLGFFLFAAILSFVYYRGTALLHFLQQEEYDNDRFLRWLFRRRVFDKKATLLILTSFILWYFLKEQDPPLYNFILLTLFIPALIIGIMTSRPTKKAKKPLVMTARAQRILYTYLVLIGFYFSGILLTFEKENLTALMLSFVVFFQWPPFFLVAANFILIPVEEIITARYVKQARNKMKDLNPVIIAVTGSYGKTSIKHLLAHILSSMAPTLATPGSVNTIMGVTRIIRENLEKKHRYFVVEMGAYGPGSIKKLCQLAPPQLGIISGVGLAHFERFKSLRTVFKSKFEMANNLNARDKKTIINGSEIPDYLLKPYMKQNQHLVVCGSPEEPNPGAVNLVKCRQTTDGLEIELKISSNGSSKIMTLKVPLYGEHQGTNVMLAAAAALNIGVPMEVIKASLKTMPQIRHRLEVTRTKAGPLIIDDAYNSNPTGFASALETLKVLKNPGGRAILITPGMVELGKEHGAQHHRLGEEAGKIVNVALVVGPARIKSFIEGFQKTAPKSSVLKTFETQKEAEDWVNENVRKNDVVLFENNLPDIYEAEIRY